VAVEITPEPTPEERDAILAALAQSDSPDERSAWWAAGVRESSGDEPEEPEP
jgi:hypothetical protein